MWWSSFPGESSLAVPRRRPKSSQLLGSLRERVVQVFLFASGFCNWHPDCLSVAQEMLKVTVVESSGEAVRLRVEGRLTTHSVEELRRTCDLHALSDGIQLTLDLADVSFADAAGIELLKELGSRLVTLHRPSSLVTEQLKS
jgi:hypothetical protein